MITLALVALLVATMLTAGTSLTVAGVAALLRRPLALVVATAVVVVAVPALAVLLVRLLELEGPIAYGVILAAAAPGGGTGVLLTYHAKGDLALGVSLQGALGVLGLAAVPAWSLAAPYAGVPLTGSASFQVIAVLVAQVIPIGAGMWLRAGRPLWADAVQRVSRRVADVLLISSTLYILFTTADQLAGIPGSGWAIFLLLTVVCLVAYTAPGLGAAAARRAVAMTTTVRNLSLALLIAGLSADATRVSLTVLAYGLVMYAVTGLAVIPLRRTTHLGRKVTR
ncbi:hypothetical protein [Nonomuraea sp. NPDC049309]|uniref:hypothetical protein n=1 Tax=Nonomuraea sp. NPDC049309 TaxID=3364350 RepID=UPI00371CF58E